MLKSHFIGNFQKYAEVEKIIKQIFKERKNKN